MQKNLTQLKVQINGKDHIFMCDIDSSTIEVKEALFQFQKYVGHVEDNAKLMQEQAQKEEVSISDDEQKIEELKA